MQISTTTIRLRTGEGEMKCHQAQPRGQGKFPAVIVIMEAFGLNDHIKDVTERIAAEGYVAVAPDLYYRESPNVVGYNVLIRWECGGQTGYGEIQDFFGVQTLSDLAHPVTPSAVEAVR